MTSLNGLKYLVYIVCDYSCHLINRHEIVACNVLLLRHLFRNKVRKINMSIQVGAGGTQNFLGKPVPWPLKNKPF